MDRIFADGQAYGIFLTHYIFIIWLQYAVYDYPWPASVKFAIVLGGTLALSWAVTALLRPVLDSVRIAGRARVSVALHSILTSRRNYCDDD